MNDGAYQMVKHDMMAFLKDHFVMELATSYDNQPTCSPVIYVLDDEGCFYFVTYRLSFKAQNLIKNPQCSLAIWEFLKMCVQANGVAAVVEDQNRIEWVMDEFADAATRGPNFWAPIFRIQRGDYCVFKITPTWMRVLDLTHTTVRQADFLFTEIHPFYGFNATVF
jgi:nitroimidazol reductase NimA-like FMN-containing flavoprotein (pyridoxamine 5'-phosphate oxidase superfamily)